MPGLTTGTLHGKLGIRAGNTGLINLDDVGVPAEHRIGEEGEGFLIAMSAIDQGRYTVAAGAVGLAQACLDASRPLRARAPDVRRGDRPAPAGQADDREDGAGHRDRPAARSGGPAGSRTRACATRARRASPSGTPPSTRSRARSTRSRSTAPTATANEFPVERYLRNSKAAVIYEGTSQLHTLIQADYALGYREDRPLRCEPWPAQGWERPRA